MIESCLIGLFTCSLDGAIGVDEKHVDVINREGTRLKFSEVFFFFFE